MTDESTRVSWMFIALLESAVHKAADALAKSPCPKLPRFRILGGCRLEELVEGIGRGLNVAADRLYGPLAARIKSGGVQPVFLPPNILRQMPP
jgi:hypothetical protein